MTINPSGTQLFLAVITGWHEGLKMIDTVTHADRH